MSRAGARIDPWSDTEFEVPAWDSDLDLSAERPKGALLRGSALATFMIAAVVTTVAGAAGALAITHATHEPAVRPRFAFTGAAWLVSPSENRDSNAPSEPLTHRTCDLASQGSDAARRGVHALGSVVAAAGGSVLHEADRFVELRRQALATRSQPALVNPPPRPAPAPVATTPPSSTRSVAEPPAEPDDDALLANLPGIEALEATADRLADAPSTDTAAVEPAPEGLSPAAPTAAPEPPEPTQEPPQAVGHS